MKYFLLTILLICTLFTHIKAENSTVLDKDRVAQLIIDGDTNTLKEMGVDNQSIFSTELRDGYSMFSYAIINSSLPVVQYMLDNGASVVDLNNPNGAGIVEVLKESVNRMLNHEMYGDIGCRAYLNDLCLTTLLTVIGQLEPDQQKDVLENVLGESIPSPVNIQADWKH